MVPGSPELWFVILLAIVFSVPVLVALLAFLNRAKRGDDRDEELEELRQRVEELESERE